MRLYNVEASCILPHAILTLSLPAENMPSCVLNKNTKQALPRPEKSLHSSRNNVSEHRNAYLGPVVGLYKTGDS